MYEAQIQIGKIGGQKADGRLYQRTGQDCQGCSLSSYGRHSQNIRTISTLKTLVYLDAPSWTSESKLVQRT